MKNLAEKINKLKEARRAIILAHNYQLPEVQDIADFVGDSLALAQKVMKVKEEIIVVCGVKFMAETVKILNPDKKVLLPDKTAGCPMAEMIDVQKVRQLKNRYPDATVVCYVNSTVEVKAESDICCTSSNAQKVINSLKDYQQIIFIPDKQLGHFVSLSSDKEFIFCDGYCPVHNKITERNIKNLKKQFPRAEVLVHPECSLAARNSADKILSTGWMQKYVSNSSTKDFIIGTDSGIIHQIKKQNPEKNFYPANKQAICEDMKKISLEKIADVLENLNGEVEVNGKVGLKAKRGVEKMLKVG
ncbi:MAG: quinolinate synthase NadA [Patescibacteria group bacterium]|nr:quinolinate synthase NadA [Patescibacteria group bacterium]